MSRKELSTRADNFPQWYLDVIDAADLAEHGDVKGTMIIKPWGYAIWERIQRILDDKIKETGHQNAYFPLFVPKSFLSKEADHVEGFAKETAVVTHHRLMSNPNGDGVVVDPEAKLGEEIIVRPTSETIIHSAFSRWIQSYRDLPMLINQWANVVRWEMRTRLFLRTTEFLWQEGHTAHSTEENAEEETRKMLDVYAWFAREVMAMAVVPGEKTEIERFAGALRTYTIEAMMQDGKALQAGTSHNLGQSFSKAFNVTFSDTDNTEKLVWMTSWGVSTRLMGGLIMTHSDDKGLVLPPALAPHQVVIVPFMKKDGVAPEVTEAVEKMVAELQEAGVRVKYDDREYESMGAKLFEWEKKGVPMRIEIGPRDLGEGKCVVARRDQEEKKDMQLEGLVVAIQQELDDMQSSMLAASEKRLNDNIVDVTSEAELAEAVEAGKFARAYWAGSNDEEERIAKEYKATARCIPFAQAGEEGTCIVSGEATSTQVLFAKAY